MNEIERIQESSQYLATLLRGHREYRDWLFVENNLQRRYPLTELYEDLQKTTMKAQTFSELLPAFREFKQRHFLRIGGRDLLGWADLPETTGQISDLAAVALQVGLEVLSHHPGWWLLGEEAKSWGRVREAAQLVVLGLGKLGGHELNYVSDVDLVFSSCPKAWRGSSRRWREHVPRTFVPMAIPPPGRERRRGPRIPGGSSPAALRKGRSPGPLIRCCCGLLFGIRSAMGTANAP